MVVHAGGAEKNLPLPSVGKDAGGQKYAPPTLPPLPPYSASTVVPVKTRSRPKKCCIISSILCNLLLLAVVIILGSFMIAHVKQSKCANKVHRATQRLNKAGYAYQVDDCAVKKVYSVRGNVIDEIIDEVMEDFEDEMFDDDGWKKSPKSPKRWFDKGSNGG